jgi:hypothetical protein
MFNDSAAELQWRAMERKMLRCNLGRETKNNTTAHAEETAWAEDFFRIAKILRSLELCTCWWCAAREEHWPDRERYT